jgi:RND family efflux transporter MFP subunit
MEAAMAAQAKRVWLPNLTVALFAGLGLAACQNTTADEVPKPGRPVLTTTVKFEPRIARRSFVATIRPRFESDLGFRVPGKVARRVVHVGDAVKAGQLLALLDETDLRLQLDQAEAERNAAAAALTQAEAELNRVLALRRQGWSTAATHERQQLAAEEARGRSARAERSVALARNSLSYARLAADANGVVTATLVEPGQVVAAGQPAIRHARLAEKEAVVAIPESQLAQARTGEATASLWSGPDRTYAARLRELSPSADAATRTYIARFALPGAGPEVELGMTATVTVAEAAGEAVARLPLSALYNQGDGPGIWVVDAERRPVLRPVAVAGYEANEVLVAGGIAEGEEVVTLGVQKLDPGQRVRVVQALRF